MNYEDMLKKAYDELPEIRVTKKRFEMPRVSSNVEGNSTIIINFLQIVDYLNRDKKHIIKHFSRELATQGNEIGKKVSFVGKFPNYRLQKVLESYVKEFVVCNQCGHADTKIVKEDRINFVECMACNARYTIRVLK